MDERRSRHMMRFNCVALVLLSFTAAACARHADDLSHPPAHPEVRVGTCGVACYTFQRRTEAGEASYNVEDVGKPGVPTLTSAQIRLVSRIQKYVRTSTFEIHIRQWERIHHLRCSGRVPALTVQPGYWILNASPSDAFYEPGEAPGFIHAVPGEVAPTPGPWMRP
jgi:hypothetical protein